MNRAAWQRTSRKKPKQGELTPGEKRHNRHLTRLRVRAEHSIGGVKRVRVVKDTLHNTKANFSDLAMELACGMHNLRVRQRKRRLRKL
jgi:DDE superfamily endonuclease